MRIRHCYSLFSTKSWMVLRTESVSSPLAIGIRIFESGGLPSCREFGTLVAEMSSARNALLVTTRKTS